MYKLQYANGETDQLNNLSELTDDQRQDVRDGIAAVYDADGNEVDIDAALTEEAPATEIPDALDPEEYAVTAGNDDDPEEELEEA